MIAAAAGPRLAIRFPVEFIMSKIKTFALALLIAGSGLYTLYRETRLARSS